MVFQAFSLISKNKEEAGGGVLQCFFLDGNQEKNPQPPT
jgi:hypothetical protein